MIRLDEKQYRAVKKMTRAACANNDCGNCLLLDDGETCVCVQSISYSLLCRYFREAVLPADRQLCRTDHPQRGNRFEALRGMRQHVLRRAATGRNTAPIARQRYAADRKPKARETGVYG